MYPSENGLRNDIRNVITNKLMLGFTRNILLLILPTESDWQLVEGIARYNQAAGWRVRIAKTEQEARRGIERWNPVGLICNAYYIDKIKVDRPTVTVFGSNGDCDSVDMDHAGVAQLAVKYFADKGFRNFVFVTGRMRTMSLQRWPVYQREAEKLGGHAWLLESGCETGLLPSVQTDEGLQRMGKWLKSLPRPLAVLAVNDHHGLYVIDACQGAGLSVPEEISVLGVDDDPHVCQLAHPALSSIRLPFANMGHVAAHMLDKRLGSPRSRRQQLIFAPEGISNRRSTDILAISCPAVVKALQFISATRNRSIRASEVSNAAGVSKTLLQNKFREFLGRTPLQEINRQRVDHASDLLRETGLSLEDVAVHCGFSDAAQFSKLFKKYTGSSPGKFRSAKPLVKRPGKL